MKLKDLKDGQKFRLSKRSKVVYKRIKANKKMVIYTSLNSELSFCRPGNKFCFPVK